jgi:transcriptional regulator with XRE-family HTH domain
MLIADRLRQLRIEKDLSQGDIEKRTGLLKCYVSRVECGHTVPAVETLEKFANALEVPMYQLFYDGEEPAKVSRLRKARNTSNSRGAETGSNDRVIAQLRTHLDRMGERNRGLLCSIARAMARSKATRTH